MLFNFLRSHPGVRMPESLTLNHAGVLDASTNPLGRFARGLAGHLAYGVANHAVLDVVDRVM